MAPAFSSWRQALAFALLLLMVLALPAVCGRPGFFSRQDSYAAMPAGAGDFRYVNQQTFEDKSDLDIVFFGPSSLLYGIDTPYVQRQLSAHLGRPARVITLGSFLEGEDRTYLMLRELLQHRRVKMLVLKTIGDDAWQRNPDFTALYDAPNAWMYRYFQFGEDREAMAGLPFRHQAAIYAGAILGMPRHLLSLVRAETKSTPRTAQTLGADPKRMGYNWNDAAFEVYKPNVPALPLDAVLHSTNAWKDLQYVNRELGSYPVHFAKKIGELLREHGVHLVILHVPFIQSETGSKELREVARWPEVFGVPAELVGAPEAQLFAGLSDDQFKKLWADFQHLNANGQEYFTQIVTPALIELYDKDTHR